VSHGFELDLTETSVVKSRPLVPHGANFLYCCHWESWQKSFY